jgi:hypothetical protein
MKRLSAGEITKGMYVVVYEIVTQKEVTTVAGRTETEDSVDKHPWIKGIPFKVINVNGPIIAVDTLQLHKGSLAPVAFFDARFHKFLETTKAFHDEYVRLMKGESPRQRKRRMTSARPVRSSNVIGL